ncbi:hypothetical protein L596_026630 [Steinernema carpocapsae]|uniref:Uncharacterized protein n=1 Tax=Steinernema carpocapsae TaxID=34508 RepID=A0A4U5M1X8_STECR|nr:hypothetical protein L596_026630 [Steinernema carpocapsae]
MVGSRASTSERRSARCSNRSARGPRQVEVGFYSPTGAKDAGSPLHQPGIPFHDKQRRLSETVPQGLIADAKPLF